MTTSQRNYAQIEKEMMAIVFGCEKFHHYVMGRQFNVTTDHKPLEVIFRKPLHAVPLRLQRMRIRLQRYQLNVTYSPGLEIPVADMLSRHFESSDELPDLNSFDDEVQAFVHLVTSSLPISDQKMEEIKLATKADQQLQEVIQAIRYGWTDTRRECTETLRNLWTFRDELSYVDGVVFKGSKVIIPKAMRPSILQSLHSGHMGVVKCKDRARDLLFWPNMSLDIENTVQTCSVCQRNRMTPTKEPMISSEVPNLPWQVVATDLFHLEGQEYIVVVDYYSRFFEVALLSSTRASCVITHLKSIFGRHEIPMRVVSDNGPQYSSGEFRDFSVQWGFEHITSSPHYPQANELAEKTVQTVKHLLHRARQSGKDPYLALLACRNTPLYGSGSPAELPFGRRLRSVIPCSQELLKPKVINSESVKEALTKSREVQKLYYDRGSKPRSPLPVNQAVRMQRGKEWLPASVVRPANTPRSYVIRTQDGAEYRRNFRQLIPTKEMFPKMNNLFQEPSVYDKIPSPNSSEVPVSYASVKTPQNASQQQTQSDIPGRQPVSYTSRGRAIFRPKRFFGSL